MRILIYVDSVYREADGAVYGDISFTLFLADLGSEMDVTIIGRLDPDCGPARYRIPDHVGFVALPHYESLSNPLAALASLARSQRLFWRALGETDGVWLFGPYLAAQVFAILTLVRRRRVALGVRQDFPTYVRRRRPSARWMHLAADLLERSWRLWARRLPTVVVGSQLAEHYGNARQLLTISVSLITDQDIADGRQARERDYHGQLQLLSVGRLDEEKNPLLLADVLAGLRARDSRWALIVCGDGPLETALAQRLAQLGVAEHAQLRGHIGLRQGLLDLYRTSHALLHVSWTEGFPQVLIEAFASGVPVVATAVGGVERDAGATSLLIGPGDAHAAVNAVDRIARDPELRRNLVEAGFAEAAAHTMQHEIGRVAAFLRLVPRRGPGDPESARPAVDRSPSRSGASNRRSARR
jgi:glycosyltransferase involved in cell wall biosynthesis